MVASIFSFRTMGQWEHWDYYTASTFCISCNIVSAVGQSRYLFIVRLSFNEHFIVVNLGPTGEWLDRAAAPHHCGTLSRFAK